MRFGQRSRKTTQEGPLHACWYQHLRGLSESDSREDSGAGRPGVIGRVLTRLHSSRVCVERAAAGLGNSLVLDEGQRLPWKGGCPLPGQEQAGGWGPTPGRGSGGSARPRWEWLGWAARACLSCCPGAPAPGKGCSVLGWPPGGPAPPARPVRTCPLVKGGACSLCTQVREGRRVLTAHRRSSVKQQVLTCSCWVRPADLGILLGLALGNEGLEPWPLTQSDACAVTGFLRDKLQYQNRLQYMVPSGPRRVLFPMGPCPSLAWRQPRARPAPRTHPEPGLRCLSLPLPAVRRPSPASHLTLDPTSTWPQGRRNCRKSWGKPRHVLLTRVIRTWKL